MRLGVMALVATATMAAASSASAQYLNHADYIDSVARRVAADMGIPVRQTSGVPGPGSDRPASAGHSAGRSADYVVPAGRTMEFVQRVVDALGPGYRGQYELVHTNRERQTDFRFENGRHGPGPAVNGRGPYRVEEHARTATDSHAHFQAGGPGLPTPELPSSPPPSSPPPAPSPSYSQPTPSSSSSSSTSSTSTTSSSDDLDVSDTWDPADVGPEEHGDGSLDGLPDVTGIACPMDPERMPPSATTMAFVDHFLLGLEALGFGHYEWTDRPRPFVPNPAAGFARR